MNSIDVKNCHVPVVITKRGIIIYDEEDIQEFITNFEEYKCSDNLPKWLLLSNTKEKVYNFLLDILSGNVTDDYINVSKDNYQIKN